MHVLANSAIKIQLKLTYYNSARNSCPYFLKTLKTSHIMKFKFSSVISFMVLKGLTLNLMETHSSVSATTYALFFAAL